MLKITIKIIIFVSFSFISAFANNNSKVYSWSLNDSNGLVTHGRLQISYSNCTKAIKSSLDVSMDFLPTSKKFAYVTNDRKFYKVCNTLALNFINKNIFGLLSARLGAIIYNILLENNAYSISSKTTHVFSFKSNKKAKRFYKILIGDFNTWRYMSNEFRIKDHEMRNSNLSSIPHYANKDDCFITKRIYFKEIESSVAKKILHIGDREITVLNPFALNYFSQQWMKQHCYVGSSTIDFIVLEGIVSKPLAMKISPRLLDNNTGELNNNQIIFELSTIMMVSDPHPRLLIRIFTKREDNLAPFEVLGIEIEENNYQLCINTNEFNVADNLPPPEYSSEYLIDL